MPLNILPGKLLLKYIQGVVVIPGKMGHIDWCGISLDSHPSSMVCLYICLLGKANLTLELGSQV